MSTLSEIVQNTIKSFFDGQISAESKNYFNSPSWGKKALEAFKNDVMAYYDRKESDPETRRRKYLDAFCVNISVIRKTIASVLPAPNKKYKNLWEQSRAERSTAILGRGLNGFSSTNSEENTERTTNTDNKKAEQKIKMTTRAVSEDGTDSIKDFNDQIIIPDILIRLQTAQRILNSGTDIYELYAALLFLTGRRQQDIIQAKATAIDGEEFAIVWNNLSKKTERTRSEDVIAPCLAPNKDVVSALGQVQEYMKKRKWTETSHIIRPVKEARIKLFGNDIIDTHHLRQIYAKLSWLIFGANSKMNELKFISDILGHESGVDTAFSHYYNNYKLITPKNISGNTDILESSSTRKNIVFSRQTPNMEMEEDFITVLPNELFPNTNLNNYKKKINYMLNNDIPMNYSQFTKLTSMDPAVGRPEVFNAILELNDIPKTNLKDARKNKKTAAVPVPIVLNDNDEIMEAPAPAPVAQAQRPVPEFVIPVAPKGKGRPPKYQSYIEIIKDIIKRNAQVSFDNIKKYDRFATDPAWKAVYTANKNIIDEHNKYFE